MNQPTQLHQISEHFREYEHSFSPYYCDSPTEILRRLGLIEFTIVGNKLNVSAAFDIANVCHRLLDPAPR